MQATVGCSLKCVGRHNTYFIPQHLHGWLDKRTIDYLAYHETDCNNDTWQGWFVSQMNEYCLEGVIWHPLLINSRVWKEADIPIPVSHLGSCESLDRAYLARRTTSAVMIAAFLRLLQKLPREKTDAPMFLQHNWSWGLSTNKQRSRRRHVKCLGLSET